MRKDVPVGQCARLLGVSRDYIYDEIARGRLKAAVVRFPSGRVRYHISPDDFAAYKQQHWSSTAA